MPIVDRIRLAEMIAQMTGQEINADEIDEETLTGLIALNNNDGDDDGDVDNDEDDEDNDGEGDNDDNDGDLDDDDDNDDNSLDNVDRDSLDPATRMIYDALMSERKKIKKKEIDIEIGNSGLHIKHKLLLNTMAKNGTKLSDIKKTIADLKEFEKSVTRKSPTGNFTSKTKVKKTNIAKDKVKTEPKFGTAEFGKMLAQNKKK